MLNDKVFPCYAAQGTDLLRILNDRGSEYCGKPENLAYELYIRMEHIDPTKIQVHSPQTHGICARFHRTTKQEFYNMTFGKNTYYS